MTRMTKPPMPRHASHTNLRTSGVSCNEAPTFQLKGFRFIARAFALFFLLFAILLVALGLSVTAVFDDVLDGGVLSEGMSPLFILWPSTAIRMLPALVLCVLEGVLLWLVWSKVRVSPPVLCGIVCSVILIVQVVWVLALGSQGYIYPDSNYLIEGGKALAAGDYSVFSEPEGFVTINLHWYPFQAGGVYLFSLFFQPGVSAPYQFFQITNAVCNTATAVLLFQCCRMLTDDERVHRVVCALLLACLPLMFSCAFMYGNSIGLFFSVLACDLLMYAFLTQGKARVASLVGCALAIFVGRIAKSTLTLFLIPLALVAILVAADRKNVKACIATVLVGVVIWQTGGMPRSALEAQVGTDFGDGMPGISWIAIGLDHDAKAMPGWWTNQALLDYESVDGDYEKQTKIARQHIQEEVDYFVTHPGDALVFFGMKLATEWGDPSYQSIYYTSLSLPETSGICRAGIEASASYDNPLGWHLDAYQLLIYLGVAAYAWRLFREKDIRGTDFLIITCILVGAFVYMLWEAKSVYVFPFFMLMLPLAACGIARIFGRIETHSKASRESVHA
jgi:hypothetical protein